MTMQPMSTFNPDVPCLVAAQGSNHDGGPWQRSLWMDLRHNHHLHRQLIVLFAQIVLDIARIWDEAVRVVDEAKQLSNLRVFLIFCDVNDQFFAELASRK